jgi:hypothetical protein
MIVKNLNGATKYCASHNPNMSVKLIMCEADKDNPKKINVLMEGFAFELYSKDGELIIRGMKQ